MEIIVGKKYIMPKLPEIGTFRYEYKFPQVITIKSNSFYSDNFMFDLIDVNGNSVDVVLDKEYLQNFLKPYTETRLELF